MISSELHIYILVGHLEVNTTLKNSERKEYQDTRYRFDEPIRQTAITLIHLTPKTMYICFLLSVIKIHSKINHSSDKDSVTWQAQISCVKDC
jgi:hypothetical protein